MRDIFQMEKNKLFGSLICPNCNNPLSITQILHNCSVAWPYQNWILLKCPLCNGYSHVEVITDKISTGVLGGAPGPCFFTCSESKVNGFDVITSSEFVECRFEEKEYKFFSKR